MERADRLLVESSVASHYATLVCGRASRSGDLEIVNAGHCAPVVVRSEGAIEMVDTTGLPLGLGIGTPAEAQYRPERIHLNRGDSLVLYTDGLTEAADRDDNDYGTKRLQMILQTTKGCTPKQIVARCMEDLAAFLHETERADDLTILVLQRSE